MKQDWATPQEDYDDWDLDYAFTFDPCCTLDNCKAPDGLFHDLGQDGLIEPWRGRVFMNPPYNELKKWVARAACEVRFNPAVELVVGLLPARTDTRAFHEHIWDKAKRKPRPGVQIDFLQGRLTFGSDEYWAKVWETEFLATKTGTKENPLYQKYGRKNSAPFPSMLVKWELDKCANL